MPTIAPPYEDDDQDDPAEQGKWGEQDMPAPSEGSLQDLLPEWPDEDDRPAAARQSQQ